MSTPPGILRPVNISELNLDPLPFDFSGSRTKPLETSFKKQSSNKYANFIIAFYVNFFLT